MTPVGEHFRLKETFFVISDLYWNVPCPVATAPETLPSLKMQFQPETWIMKLVSAFVALAVVPL